MTKKDKDIISSALNNAAINDYSHVKNVMAAGILAKIQSEIDPAKFTQPTDEDKQVYYLDHDLETVPTLRKWVDEFTLAVASRADKYPGLKAWSGGDKIVVPIVKYQDDASMDKHQDGGPGNVVCILTISGGATFELYETMTSKSSKAKFDVKAGDLVLLNGKDLTAKELPIHSVKNNKGRLIALITH